MMPDLQQFYMMIYGGYGYDLAALEDWASQGTASGLIVGTNPPYTLTDMLGVYPKFFGASTAATAAITAASTSATLTAAVAGLAVSQLVTGPDIAYGTTVTAITGTALTLSAAAVNTNAAEPLALYTAPPVPTIVLQMYINLALASLMQQRWREAWNIAMALYVAHYVTLYMRSESGPNATAQQIAASGLAQGIAVSKAALDVSVSIQLPQLGENAGHWQQTEYGIQLYSLARTIGRGPIFVG